ncbi:hypothetical protein DESC_290158 [Desulfosarcina cetonica]|uniref:hypothetical protein n=1 Tax=Desulfosarcina cetonica TaxID=90730 RepID=UPI0006D119E7|nr:hypothetical protein [Desulfosarcina cetonica]VTR65088.1 hypothetical protein DESC_290158 [Desulfosarcina cetonica]
MRPFKINMQNGTLEVVAKITDSLVQDYGCRVKYDKENGAIDLVGEEYCRDVVNEVLTDILKF